MKTYQLKNDLVELTFVPSFGCHWTSLKYRHKDQWLDLLYPVPDLRMLPVHSTRDGSYILAPWSNRLVDASFVFENQRYQLFANFPDGTAIHGDVWTRPWEVMESSLSRFQARLVSEEHDDFNYPFPLTFTLTMTLEGSDLKTNLSIENNHVGKAPVGMGFHPFWKRRLTDYGSDVLLKLPANKVYPTKEAIPQVPAEPVSVEKDLRQGKDLKGIDLDDCFTGLTTNTIQLTYTNPGVRIDYKCDPIFGHVVVYSPLDEKGVPKDFVAVEPVTNVTDGFNLAEEGWGGTGVKVLNPKEKWGGSWICSFSSL